MNAAACSWRVRTSWIDDLRIDSTTSRFSSPGIPKIRSTPSFSRAAISTSEPLFTRRSPGALRKTSLPQRSSSKVAIQACRDTDMNTVCESPPSPGGPSVAARSMIDRLIAFRTVSRDSNLGLIEWVRDYLQGHGAKTRLTHDATGRKANLFATLGDSKKRGLILSGHTDVVPVDGQAWETDPFAAIERDGKLFARGSADMKGFIGIILAQAPKFVAALNDNRLDAPLHYSLSYDEEV